MDLSSDQLNRLQLRKAAGRVVLELLEVRRQFSAITETYDINAYIDTSDILIIHSNTLQWEHNTTGQPAGGENGARPTFVTTTLNGNADLTNATWNQTYPNPLPADAFSTPFVVDPALFTNNPSATASVVTGRGTVTIIQQPSAVNDYTLKAQFTDAANGAAYTEGLITVVEQGQTSVGLGSPVTISTGEDSKALAVADVNGDGHPDMVIADYRQATLSVLIGFGNGTFNAPVTYQVGNDPTSVAVGDLDGDGRPDIAVSNYKDNTVGVLINNGDGTFGAQATYLTEQILSQNGTYGALYVHGGQGPDSVAIADTNGDGRPDLIVGNDAYTINTSGTDAVLINNGDGSFGLATDYFVNGHPSQVVTADLNNDGVQDIISTADGTNNVDVIVGNSNGTFKPHQDFAVGRMPSSVAVGDLNGDGKLDLVVANTQDNNLSILYGNNDGTFATQQLIALTASPGSVTIAYLNGNNLPDIVVTSFSSNSAEIIAGNGDGTFATEQTFSFSPLTASAIGATAVTVADVTGDGLPDVIVSDYYARSISILPFQGGQAVPVANLLNNKLNVMGGPGSDTITLDVSGSSVVGFINGNGFGPYPLADIQGFNVQGYDGNDSITLGAGISNVFVQGGTGSDIIVDNGSGAGLDTLNGSSGADSIVGGSVRELLNGGKGPDSVQSGTGADTIHGGRGFDSLVGTTSGNAQIFGGLGRDTIVSSTGASSATDTLFGGLGDDSIRAHNQDSIIASGGNDTIIRS